MINHGPEWGKICFKHAVVSLFAFIIQFTLIIVLFFEALDGLNGFMAEKHEIGRWEESGDGGL
jgi:hypothetical protein